MPALKSAKKRQGKIFELRIFWPTNVIREASLTLSILYLVWLRPLRGPRLEIAESLAPARQDRLDIGSRHYHGLHVLADIGLAGGGAQFGQIRMDLAEGRENLSMGRPERIAINGAVDHKGRGHVPVSDHHSKCRVSRSRIGAR